MTEKNKETKKENEEGVIKNNTGVQFTNEQLEVIAQLIKDNNESIASRGTANSTMFSVYDNMRDIKEIRAINVWKFDGKFVVGLKDHQQDPRKKALGIKQYTVYKVDPIRKSNREPFITLMLSNDGVEITELEVNVGEYTEFREKETVDVIEIKEERVVKDHGALGSSGFLATSVDDKLNPMRGMATKAQSSYTVKNFVVQLPGFKDVTVFEMDNLGGCLA